MQEVAFPQSAQDRFQALLDANRGIVLKVANTYGRFPEDRQDLAQEISVQLWKAFGSFDDRRSFATWMYRISLNVAISYARHAGIRERSSVSLDAPVMESFASEQRDERGEHVRSLMNFIERMDEMNRAIMLLYLEDRTYQEIAEIMGISESNVGTKINRIKQRIREELA